MRVPRVAVFLMIFAGGVGALAAVTAAAATPAAVPAVADFSGNWVFNAGKSRNVGMMASLEMKVAVEQTPLLLTVREQSTFQGQQSSREVRYDLTGRPTPNVTPMGDKSETVARWEGGRLVTTWTSEGAVAGSRVVRTETRSLAADGKTMLLESVRGSAAPLVMVFERE